MTVLIFRDNVFFCLNWNPLNIILINILPAIHASQFHVWGILEKNMLTCRNSAGDGDTLTNGKTLTSNDRLVGLFIFMHYSFICAQYRGKKSLFP